MDSSAGIVLAEQVELTADLVSAYVSNNHIQPAELPGLIAGVHAALIKAIVPRHQAEAEIQKPTPAQIRRSITRDALISFVDGKPYRTLKRHLTKHGLDPRAYRELYGLPSDYPLTAQAYSEARSALARNLGLGRRVEPEPEPVIEAPRSRGRRKKAEATV